MKTTSKTRLYVIRAEYNAEEHAEATYVELFGHESTVHTNQREAKRHAAQLNRSGDFGSAERPRYFVEQVERDELSAVECRSAGLEY